MLVTSEKQVEYLFARFHHLLGFEKVLKFGSSFPDVIALRNGVVTRVELESKLSHVAVHYKVAVAYENLGQKFNRKEVLDEEGDNLFIKEYKFLGQRVEELRRKSLKPVLDVIVCWIIDFSEPTRNKILVDGYDSVEVIELKSKLEELGFR